MGLLDIVIPNIVTGDYNTRIKNVDYDFKFILPERDEAKTCLRQINFARVIVTNTNMNQKVLLITNSDFIIREINNCIMLSNEFDGKAEFMANNDYDCDHCLSAEKVSGYYCGDKEIKAIKMNKYGLICAEICNVINNANDVSDFLSDKMEELESDS